MKNEFKIGIRGDSGNTAFTNAEQSYVKAKIERIFFDLGIEVEMKIWC